MRKPILVVDDEPDIRELLRDVLEDEGYEVELAEDGQQALDVLDRVEPCLMILDIRMPVLDGVAVLARMRNHPAWKHVPVIVSTSDPSRAPSGVLIIRKPVDLDLLLEAVKACART